MGDRSPPVTFAVGCEFYCPYPCPSAHVKDVLDVVREGADVEGTVKGHALDIDLDWLVKC